MKSKNDLAALIARDPSRERYRNCHEEKWIPILLAIQQVPNSL
jgi:hypothetical protein